MASDSEARFHVGQRVRVKRFVHGDAAKHAGVEAIIAEILQPDSDEVVYRLRADARSLECWFYADELEAADGPAPPAPGSEGEAMPTYGDAAYWWQMYLTVRRALDAIWRGNADGIAHFSDGYSHMASRIVEKIAALEAAAAQHQRERDDLRAALEASDPILAEFEKSAKAYRAEGVEPLSWKEFLFDAADQDWIGEHLTQLLYALQHAAASTGTEE